MKHHQARLSVARRLRVDISIGAASAGPGANSSGDKPEGHGWTRPARIVCRARRAASSTIDGGDGAVTQTV